MQYAEFRDQHGDAVTVDVIRRSSKTCRVKFADGKVDLVKTELLRFVEVEPATKLVPQTPLRRLYQATTRFKRSRKDRFDELCNRLSSRHGPKDHRFLAELFARSRAAMEFYQNEGSPFHNGLRTRNRKKDPDAQRLVDCFRPDKQGSCVRFDCGSRKYEYVDREVCPTRTDMSCLETGVAAKNSGSGGMDLLLLSVGKNPVPAVGEIKAATENVGPTYALIQALTYAAELTTQSQWTRLRLTYKSMLGVCPEIGEPRIDIVLLLQEPVGRSKSVPQDIEYAKQLVQGLLREERVASAIRCIEFLSWRLEGNTAVITPA